LSARCQKQNDTILEASILDLHEALNSGLLTSLEIVDYYLHRITKYDQQGPKLNSIITLNPKASRQAEALDQERREKGSRSPLHGIPIVLKDNIDTSDLPTTGGSQPLVHLHPQRDAFITKKLREAGAIILAKVNLHELARLGFTVSSLRGQTLNPYDLTRTPGGSSGGTAVAVAANFAAAGIGTDTVNSVRSPASATNLVGFRPTKGLISCQGLIPAALTQDTAGPITRSVQDSAILLDAMAGYDPQDPFTAWNIGHIPETYTAFLKINGLQGKRLGLLKTNFGTHSEVLKVMRQATQDITALGAEVIDIYQPQLETTSVFRRADVQKYETKPQLNAYLKSRGSESTRLSLQDLLHSGLLHKSIIPGLEETNALKNGLILPEYKDCLLEAASIRNTVVKVMADYRLDALCYPHQQVLVSKTTLADQPGRNGILASVTGFPAVTVPAGFSAPTEEAPAGVPVGIEFLGRPWTEPLLLEIAYSYEQATRHRKLPKSTP
jgi:amidase